jgi:hypothetical protein
VQDLLDDQVVDQRIILTYAEPIEMIYTFEDKIQDHVFVVKRDESLVQ